MEKLRRKAKRNIEREYNRFRKFNLRYASKKEIWEISHKVYFMSCCMEYYTLNKAIPKLYLELAIIDTTLLQTMWGVYLKHEDIGCETWPEIERILEVVVSQWKMEAA